MHRNFNLAVITTSALMLSGCVSNEPAAPAASGTTRAAAASGSPGPAGTRFDGTYSGLVSQGTSFGSGGSNCLGSSNRQTLRVENGNLQGSIFGRQLSGPISADGSVNLTGTERNNSGAPGMLEARFTGTGVDGTYSQRVGLRTTCSYSVNGLTRS